ncbi:MAG: hypothetical protein AAB452_02075 [Patescibacteria group bacterium]
MKKKFLIVCAVITIGLAATAVFFLRAQNRYAVPDDWKTYTNEKFGIQFRYPPNWQVCQPPVLHPEESEVVFDLIISQKSECVINPDNPLNSGDIYIYINTIMAATGQLQDPKDLAYDFSRGFGIIDLSINPQLKYLKLDGILAYGGPIIREKGQKLSEYSVLFVRKGNHFEIWDRYYQSHPKETEMILYSFRFDPEKYPR